MSLYCSGKGVVQLNAGFIRYNVECEKKERCLRYQAFIEYKGDSSKTGMSTGLWLVNVGDCVNHNYRDGVMEKGDNQ